MATIELEMKDEQAVEATGIQSAGYLLEMSLDWIVLRASENIHRLLGESHVTLIDEPLGKWRHELLCAGRGQHDDRQPL